MKYTVDIICCPSLSVSGIEADSADEAEEKVERMLGGVGGVFNATLKLDDGATEIPVTGDIESIEAEEEETE